MRTISAPVLALVFASLASAATLSIRQNPSARTLKHLLVRQSDTLDPSELPAQCQSLCTSAVSILNECASGGTCGCSSSDFSDLETCFNCLGNAVPSLKDTLDSDLNNYEQACQADSSSSVGTGSGSFSDSNDTPTGSGSSPEPTSSSSRGGSSSTGTGSSSSSDDSNSGSSSSSSGTGTGSTSKSGSGTSGSNSGSSGGGLGTGGAMSNSVNMFGLTLVAVFGGLLVL